MPAPMKPKAKAEPTNTTAPVNGTHAPNPDWGKLMEQFSTAAGGQVLFAKKGRTRFRILPPTSDNPFYPVASVYQGKERTKYLLTVVAPDAVQEASENDLGIRALMLTKRQITQILSLQVEGWELFDPATGHGLVMIKSGAGTQSTSSFTPSPKPMPIPEDVLEAYVDFDLEAIAKDFTERQRQRANEGKDAAEATDEE